MSMQLIPFETAKVPATKSRAVVNPFAAVAATGGFPALSTKGSKFHVIRGDSRETLMREVDGEQIPATNIDVVILDINPNKSYTYFKEGYKEGSNAGPVCFSNNAKAPDPNSKEPQAKACDSCPHRAWGSKVYDNGKKGRACEESVRLAVAPLGQLNDAMLLRIKGGSFNSLREYGLELGRFDKLPWQVATKIGFDHTAAYPLFTFKRLGILPEPMRAEAEEIRGFDIVKQITGVVASDFVPEEVEHEEPVAPAKVEAKPAAKPAAKKPEPPAEDDLPAAPKAKVEVEAPAPAKKSKPVVEDVAEEIGEMIDSSDDLDFDD